MTFLQITNWTSRTGSRASGRAPAARRARTALRRAATACAALAVVACGGDSPTGTSGTSGTETGGTSTGAAITYTGVFDTGLKGGIITLVGTPVATGRIKAAGETEVALTGTFNATTGTFNLAGGAYAIRATVDAPYLEGVVTVQGVLTPGTLAALPVSVLAPMTYWCGTTNGGGVGGLDLGIQSGTVVGVFQSSAGGLPVRGTASASDINFRWVPGANQVGTGVGRIVGTSMSGSWSNSFGGLGTCRDAGGMPLVERQRTRGIGREPRAEQR